VSAALDVTVPGEPAVCRSAATELTGVATALEGTSSELRSLLGRAGRAWTGVAADAFVAQLDTTRKDVDELADRVEALGHALDAFAGELDVVRSAMADARATAVAGGLTVVGETVLRPGDLQDGATDTEATAHPRRSWHGTRR